MGIASFVLALVSVGSVGAAFVVRGAAAPILGIAGLLMAVLAVVFGWLGRRSSQAQLARGGLVVGALPLVLGVVAIPWLLVDQPAPSAARVEDAAVGGSGASRDGAITPESEVSLVIKSSPKGAKVQLDGKDVGTTPLTKKVPLKDQVVELSLKGHAKHREKVDASTLVQARVEGGEDGQVTLNITLPPAAK